MSTDQVDPLSPFHTQALGWRIEETTSKHKRTFMEVLNTQSRTDVKGRSSSLELSGGLENSQHERTRFFFETLHRISDWKNIFGDLYRLIIVKW